MREELLQKMVLDFQKLNKTEEDYIDKYGEGHSKVLSVKNKKDILYEDIEKEYNLKSRIYTWSQSYSGFFDTYDDFLILCKQVFYQSLLSFKTKNERIEENRELYKDGEISKRQIIPKGNGELNTYFAYCLSNKLVNYYNSTQALCRNPKVRCPICFELVAPLKKHLKEDHEEYVMKAWKEKWNKEMNEFKSCPVCGVEVRDIFDHIVTRHSYIIYDLFRVEYPQYMLSEKPYSLDFRYNDDEEESTTLKDILYNDNEDTIIEELAYKNLVNKIKLSIKDKQELKMFDYMLNGYTRSEICDDTDWSYQDYAKIRNSLIKNKNIQELLAVKQ